MASGNLDGRVTGVFAIDLYHLRMLEELDIQTVIDVVACFHVAGHNILNTKEDHESFIRHEALLCGVVDNAIKAGVLIIKTDQDSKRLVNLKAFISFVETKGYQVPPVLKGTPSADSVLEFPRDSGWSISAEMAKLMDGGLDQAQGDGETIEQKANPAGAAIRQGKRKEDPKEVVAFLKELTSKNTPLGVARMRAAQKFEISEKTVTRYENQVKNPPKK
jgi:hypothetical protein